MTRQQIRKATKERIAGRGVGLRCFALEIGCDAGHLCHFLKHGTKPSPAVVAALGYRRVEREIYEAQR